MSADAPNLSDIAGWRAAREWAQGRGWTLTATGDWSWVYKSPDGRLAWRVTPFDPAFGLFARICSAQPHPLLPKIVASLAHVEGGHSTVMEWLDPAGQAEAERWFATFKSTQVGPEADLRRLLMTAANDTELPLFMGIDDNPANVMRRPGTGGFVLTDAFWINGVLLLEMVHEDPATALSHYTVEELSHWAHLPCMDAEETALILQNIGGAADTQ